MTIKWRVYEIQKINGHTSGNIFHILRNERVKVPNVNNIQKCIKGELLNTLFTDVLHYNWYNYYGQYGLKTKVVVVSISGEHQDEAKKTERKISCMCHVPDIEMEATFRIWLSFEWAWCWKDFGRSDFPMMLEKALERSWILECHLSFLSTAAPQSKKQIFSSLFLIDAKRKVSFWIACNFI